MAAISETIKICIDRDTCNTLSNPFFVRWWHPLGKDQWLFERKQIIGGITSNDGEVMVNYETIALGTQRLSKQLSPQHNETIELFADRLTTGQIKGLLSLYQANKIQYWLGEDNWEDLRIAPGQFVGYDTEKNIHSFRIRMIKEQSFLKVS